MFLSRMLLLPDPIDPSEATARGFKALTYPYEPGEGHMLKRAIEQLGEIPSVLVKAGGEKVEIWRKK